MIAAAGCGSGRGNADARDGAGDGNGDGNAGADRHDAGGDTTGTGGAAGGTGGSIGGNGGTAGGVGGTGGNGGSAGTGGGNDAAAGNDGGGADTSVPTCNDGIKNSDETGIDCGGHCGKCGPGNPCNGNSDCTFACRTSDMTCVACNVAADCPGVESECEHRTCTAGVCGTARETAGKVLDVQMTGDCKRRQCASDGTVAVVNDDTDVPDDRNPCTNDICTSGVPSHTMMPADSNCGGANHCNATGQCVGCSVAADCPGTDTACRTRTCTSGGVCGFSFTAAATKLVDPTAGDCKGLQCDGNGNSQVFNDNTDLPVDSNPCTTDECTSGTPSHRPVTAGSNCGGSLVCDGASNCVQCLSATTCAGTDTECHTRSCISGQCGVTNAAAGTLVSAQTPRDCKKNVCSGGVTVTVNDDLDLPVDGNPCTQDVCTAGTPSNPFVTAGNSCGANTICDGNGACVTCLSPSSCPGTDTDCHHRTCTNGTCGIANTLAGTAIATQTAGDCKQVQCDGNGATMTVTDDTDKPVDGNACTGDVCTGGVPSNPNLVTGTNCGTDLMCNGQGACVGCVTAANCGTDTFCQAHTCTNGMCGVTNTPAGTPLATQTAGDCKKVQCDGAGQTQTVNDDGDLPVDGNACTQDLCSGGIASNPPVTAGTTCNQSGGSKCNATGMCVQCNSASECPGTDTNCHTRTCTNGMCGVSNQPDGTAVTTQTTGDCKKNVCMSGNQVSANDDTDVPVDGNGCTMDVCTNGAPSNPPLAANAPCSENGGTRCNGSATAPACVQCLQDGQCGTNTECQSFVCNTTSGQCGSTFVANGTAVANQITGDCKKNVCNGTGAIVAAVDSSDVPVDGNQCTFDVCTNSNPSNPPKTAGSSCDQGGGTMCNSTGTCVQCLQPSDCGTDTACKTFSCTNGVCGSTAKTDGTLVTNTPVGNCHKDVCMGGDITTVIDQTDLPVDGNPCTDDVCSTGGVPSNPNINAGTTCGPNLMCDGMGACVGCISAADCPLPPNACQMRVCTSGTCGFNNLPDNTLVTTDPVGDCQKQICTNGAVTFVPDDTDLPVDNKQCTQDLCSNGTPSNPPFGQSVSCNEGGGSRCDGAGACVQCNNATDCSGSDTECTTRTCTAGVCGVDQKPAGTTVTTQVSGDCQRKVCDDSGNVVNTADDTDVPAMTNQCVTPMCVAGVPMSTNVAHGMSCTQSGGRTCDGAGSCLLTYHLVRVGSGSAALTNVATATFVEEHKLDGTLVNTVALPTAEGTTNHAFTLSGTASSLGNLSLSGDGRYVVLAGFNRATGVLGNVGNTTATQANRMPARIDAAGNVDTSTLFGNTAFSGDNIRGAATNDGNEFWLTGASTTASQGGIWYAPIGTTTTTGGVQITQVPANGRCLSVFFNQLLATSNSSPFVNVYGVGGLPTTGLQMATKVPGMPDSGNSPFSFSFVDVDGNGVVDTLYVADDGANTHGIQKWVLNAAGTSWSLFTTFNQSTALNFHGVAAYASGGSVTLITNTDEGSNPNHVIVFVDPGAVLSLTGTVVNTAATNTLYRGVALSPHL